MQTTRTNINNMASTQYTNFDFTSMCVFNGVVIGGGPDGLFKACCGDSDNGTPIDAYFTMFNTDLNDSAKKRARFIKVGMSCDGDINMTFMGDGKNAIGPYTISADITEGYQSRRVTVTSQEQFVYESLKFSNVDGSFFSIDNIKANIYRTGHSI